MRSNKWATAKFTPKQRDARRLWRLAQENRRALLDGLRLVDLERNRQRLHERLDRQLDWIEQIETRARADFPEVDESFTIATETIKF